MIDSDLQESLRNRYNPDGSELRNLQLRMISMLSYFDDFCKKNNIKYWLSSGTCLGAVRHGGFIPWDDDLDIEMMVEDYKKLVSLRNKFENKDFILQDHVTDPEYISPHGKLRDKNSELKEIHNRDTYFKYKGVFIDIFVREHGSFISTRIAHIAQYFSYTLTNIKNRHIRRFTKEIVYKAMHSILFPILHGLNRFNGEKDFLRHCLGCSFYKTIEQNGLFPLKKLRFENREYPVPGNYNSYLKRLYGNYMKLPDDLDNLRIHFKNIKL